MISKNQDNQGWKTQNLSWSLKEEGPQKEEERRVQSGLEETPPPPTHTRTHTPQATPNFPFLLTSQLLESHINIQCNNELLAYYLMSISLLLVTRLRYVSEALWYSLHPLEQCYFKQPISVTGLQPVLEYISVLLSSQRKACYY